MHVGTHYCDDTTLLIQPCDASNHAQRFAFSGTPGSQPGFLSSNESGAPLFVRSMPWWEAAGVELTKTPQQLFFSNGSLASCDPLLPDCDPGKFASATCINASPTYSNAEALLLWAKPLLDNAVAVLLVNNHHVNGSDVVITTTEVGMSLAQGHEAHVQDLWAQADLGSTQGGALKLNVGPRDSRFVLLTPP
jgi:hypothetical protein